MASTKTLHRARDSVYTSIRSWYHSHDVDAFSGYHQNRELRDVNGRLIFAAPSDTDWREIKTARFERALWSNYPA
ncbi:MAG: hypothetical protein OXT74_02210 [Candidatus Poribacteria bacterium]|nr:hypothetical protein [Candidatus Poribacteria bacterium]